MAKRRARRDTYPYVLKYGRRIVYIGVTNAPDRREQEHRNEGRRFTRMIVGCPCSEKVARKREEERIKIYQQTHKGKKPRYND